MADMKTVFRLNGWCLLLFALGLDRLSYSWEREQHFPSHPFLCETGRDPGGTRLRRSDWQAQIGSDLRYHIILWNGGSWYWPNYINFFTLCCYLCFYAVVVWNRQPSWPELFCKRDSCNYCGLIKIYIFLFHNRASELVILPVVHIHSM